MDDLVQKLVDTTVAGFINWPTPKSVSECGRQLACPNSTARQRFVDAIRPVLEAYLAEHVVVSRADLELLGQLDNEWPRGKYHAIEIDAGGDGRISNNERHILREFVKLRSIPAPHTPADAIRSLLEPEPATPGTIVGGRMTIHDRKYRVHLIPVTK